MAFDVVATNESIEKTVAALTERGFQPMVVETKADALAKIKELIPVGSDLMNGSSRTLEEIGFIDFLKSGTSGWKNRHDAILAETDEVKKAQLRKESILSDVYIGSVHAVTEGGEMVIASASGSQLPHIVYSSKHLILVIGAQKITQTLDQALARLREYVFSLENARMASVGMGGSMMSKILLYEREPAFMGRTVEIVIVKEKLGF